MLATALASDCPTPTTRDALVEALTDADAAVLVTDTSGLRDARASVDRLFPCMATALDPLDVAWYFRVQGVADFVAGSSAAESNLTAARALAPAYRLSRSLGKPIQDLWAASTLPDTPPATLPVPMTGWLVIDGVRGQTAPGGRPYVLQWVTEPGAQLTARVDVDTPLPTFPVAPPPATAATGTAPTPSARRTSRPLAIGAAASGVGAVAMGLVANSLRQQFLESELPSDQQSGTLTANRVSGGAAVGLGATAVGLGASALLVGRW